MAYHVQCMTSAKVLGKHYMPPRLDEAKTLNHTRPQAIMHTQSIERAMAADTLLKMSMPLQVLYLAGFLHGRAPYAMKGMTIAS